MSGFLQPGRGNVHLDAPLTDFSIQVLQGDEGYVHARAFPIVSVAKASDKYYVIPPDKFLLDDMQKRAPGTRVPVANYEVSNDSYSCDVWDAGHLIPDEIRANADNQVKVDQLGAKLLSKKLLTRRERQWATEFFAASVWTGDQTGVDSATPSTNQFGRWDRADSLPVETIRAQQDIMQGRSGFRPNKLVLGRQVFSKLLDHPDLIDRVKYGQVPGAPAQMSKQALAALFEVDEILVMEAVYNSAAEGATKSLGFIGGKSALLLYVDPAPGLQSVTAGVTFSWSGFMQGANLGVSVGRQRLDPEHSDLLEIFAAYDYKQTAADLGVFFATAIS